MRIIFFIFNFSFLIFHCVAASADTSATSAARAAISSGLAAPALEKPAGKLLSAGWYLISCQDQKVGYLNQALYKIDGPAPAAYRLETRHFYKAALAETRPGVLSESIMFMDKDFNALRFTTTRRRAGSLETISGEIVADKLSVTMSAGNESRAFTVPVADHPTFAGAFLVWVGKQNLEAGQPLKRSVIDENSGAFQPQRYARATAAQEMKLDKGGGLLSQTYLVEEQAGLMAAEDVFLPNGLLIRSDGRNYNLSLAETSAAEGATLKLDGAETWENQIPGLEGKAFTSGTYGYKVTLPPYPYLPVSAADGRVFLLSDLTGGPTFFLLAFSLSSATPGAAEKAYGTWTATFDSVHDVVTSTTSIGQLPAAVWQGRGRSGGRDFNFKAAVVLRGDLAYLIASRDSWPLHPAAAKNFDDLLAGLSWTAVVPRESDQKTPPPAPSSARSATSAAPAKSATSAGGP